MPEPEVPHDWDPMAGWLPQTPALPAAPGAAPTTVHTAAPGTAASSSSKAKAGGFWGRLKRRLTRSGRKGRGGSSSDGGELLAGGGAASPPPPLPSVLHTTGSMPLPPGLAAPGPAAFQATWHSRIPRPPLPGPSAGSSNGSRPASAAPAAPQGTTSSTPGGSSSRLLEMQFSHMAAASGGGSSVAPSAQQQQAQQPSRYPLPGNGGSTARRLVFSPAAAGAGAPGAEPYPTQPIPIAPAQRQQPGGGHVRRLSWQQDGHPAQPGHYAGAQQAQQQAYQQRGAMQQPAQGPASLPAAGSLPGFGAGSLPGFDAGQVQQLLGAPARSGLAGRWVREAPPRGSGGGGAGGEGEAGDSAAEVDFLLQIPPLQAAARERTRELQVGVQEGRRHQPWRQPCSALPSVCLQVPPLTHSCCTACLPGPPADPGEQRGAGPGVGRPAEQRLAHPPRRGAATRQWLPWGLSGCRHAQLAWRCMK